MQMLSQRLLTRSSFSWIFFLLVVLIGCCLFPYISNHSFLCKLFFISISVSFVSDWIFFFYTVEVLTKFLEQCFILITNVLNSTSDRLLISILFSSFPGVLICSFIWAMFLCLFILAASLCLFLCIK